MMTVYNIPFSEKVVRKYLNALIDLLFKIIPIKESGEPSLGVYMESLLIEMLGCHSLIVSLHYNELYLSIMSILQYLIENDCDEKTVKREVFKAIKLCERLQEQFCSKEETPWECGTPTNDA